MAIAQRRFAAAAISALAAAASKRSVWRRRNYLALMAGVGNGVWPGRRHHGIGG